MGLLGGLLGLLWEAVAVLSGLAGVLVKKFGVLLGGLLGGLLGVVWGWVLFGILFGLAALLNVAGIDDVAGALRRAMPGETTSGRVSVERVRDMSPEAFTDGAGRFSPATFEKVSGMTPAEFIHLYVESRGGRIKQQHLTTSLPWSNATVSRYLDVLEREGVVERVETGRKNIVCSPGSLPDRVEE